MAMAALAHPELREFMGELIVVRLVENTNCYRKRVFYVIDDRKPVLFTTHWRYKNVSGVSFKQQETVAAIEWVYHVLLVGFTAFCSSRKLPGGLGTGRSLKHGVHWEDEQRLEQALHSANLKRRPKKGDDNHE
jgi:hypothetical protein